MKAVKSDKYGASLEWPNRDRSWMPNYETACLCAAAPQLLAAAKAIVKELSIQSHGFKTFESQLKAAIDAAEGRG